MVQQPIRQQPIRQQPIRQQPILKTQRLILRPFGLEDAPVVQQLAGDRDIAAMTLAIPHPYKLHHAEEWIKPQAMQFEQGIRVDYAIVLRDQNALCGAIGLGIDPENRHAELGYWIGKPYWGQGICTEAATAILHYGFDDLNLHRIHSTHFAHNPASGRVMQKIGMHQEGYRPQYTFKWGNFEDIVQYGILKKDWQS